MIPAVRRTGIPVRAHHRDREGRQHLRRRSLMATDDAAYHHRKPERGRTPGFSVLGAAPGHHAGQAQRRDSKKSDPFLVTRWFKDCIEEFGEPLQRVCRYLKAWRDYQWPEGGGPSSIVLMIIATEEFERRARRDDIERLRTRPSALTRMLRGDIYVAAIDSKAENFNRMSDAERADAAERAAELWRSCQTARGYGASQRKDAIEKLRAVLGPRVPSDVAFVEVETDADRVRAIPAVSVTAPVVRSTRSG